MLGRLYEKAHPKKAASQGCVPQKNGMQSKGLLPMKKEFETKKDYPQTKEKTGDNPRQFLS